MNKRKLIYGGLGMLSSLMAAHAQTNTPASFTNAVNNLPGGPNIIYAMYGQVLNNPSSLLVIAFLCIMAWLADDLPFIPSKYVAHLCVIIGACMFRFFTAESTVPTSFPHPQAVFIVNGTICGFVAYIIHRQAVSRIINLVRQSTGNTEFLSRHQPPPPK